MQIYIQLTIRNKRMKYLESLNKKVSFVISAFITIPVFLFVIFFYVIFDEKDFPEFLVFTLKIILIISAVGGGLYFLFLTQRNISEEDLKIIQKEEEYELFEPFLKEKIKNSKSINYMVFLNALRKYKYHKKHKDSKNYVEEFFEKVIKEETEETKK